MLSKKGYGLQQQGGTGQGFQNQNEQDSFTNMSLDDLNFSIRSNSQRENSGDPFYELGDNMFDKLNFDFNQIQNLSNGDIKVK